MAFEGDLSHLALGDVLQTLAMSRQSGTFILRSPAEERRLIFGPRGAGLLTVRQAIRERVAEYLRGKGKVTPEDLEQVQRLSRRRKDVPLEDLLIEKGAVTDQQVAEARRYVAAEEIYDLFLWSQGTFEFQSGDPSDTVPFGGAWYDVASIAMEAARRMDEVARLKELAPASEVFRVVPDAPQPPEKKLGSDAPKVLELIDGMHTVDGILATSHLGRFDTWKAIDTLRELGLVRSATPIEMAAAADELLHTRRHAEAAAILRRLLELDPSDDNARQHLIQALTASGDKRAAAVEWIESARRAMAVGEVSKGIEAWQQAVRLDKDNAAAQDGLARALLGSGDVVAGAEAARAATSLYVDARQFDAAVAIADTAVQTCPEDAGVRIALANAHIAAGDPANALLLLDDSASLLEATGDDPRRLLDVYRRILQLDPGRKDCARRVQEIESTERYRRRRIVQRVAVAVGIVLVGLAAIPALQGPDFDVRIESVRVAVAEHRIEEAARMLEDLASSAGTDERRAQVEEVRRMLSGEAPIIRAEKAYKALKPKIEAIQQDAADAQGRSWAEALGRYHDLLDILDGPEAKCVQAGDLMKANAIRKDVVDDITAALQALQSAVAAASAKVSTAREKLAPDVFKRDTLTLPALEELVERSDEAAKIRASENWPLVVERVDSLGKRMNRVKDGLDRKILEAIQPMSDAFPVVEQGGAQALALLRTKRLLALYTQTYGQGQDLLGSGKVEAAAEKYKALLDACDDIRRAEPRELYEPIVTEVIEGFNIEPPQRERLAQVDSVLSGEREAVAALEKGDVEAAFRIRKDLVCKNRNVDFRPRFRMPVRFESRPGGASVLLLDGTPGGRLLGRAPVVFEYPIDEGATFVVRLDGFEERTVVRKGALEDAQGIEQAELPKKDEFNVAGVGNVQAPPIGDQERTYLAGRDGRVRIHSARDGTQLVAPFDTGSLDGIAGAPAVFGGRLFVATHGKAGYLLDAVTLQKVRDLTFDAAVSASLVATPRGVVVLTDAGTAQLLGADGGVLWTSHVGDVRPDAVLVESRLVFTTAAGEVVSIDAATGGDAVRVRLPPDPRWSAPVVSRSGDRAWVASDGGIVACVDLTARRVVWQVPAGAAVRARPTLAVGRLIVATTTGSVFSLDPTTGSVLGREILGGAVSQPPLALDVGWVVSTDRGAVVRFDTTGNLVWRYEARDDISSPAAAAGGKIVFVTRRGSFIGLRP